MASHDFDPKSGRYHVRFRYAGQPFKRSLQLADAKEADQVCGVVEETLKDLKRGRLVMPEGADPGAFLISGGTVKERPSLASVSEMSHQPEKATTLGDILDIYASTLTPGSKEKNTVSTERVHAKHLRRIIGEKLAFDTIGVDTLQRYLDRRAKAGVGRQTIHKELSTLRVIHSWAFKRLHVKAPVAWKMDDLTWPKASEKPPFQTWDQITRQSSKAGLTEAQKEELWESLWLNESETLACLKWVKEHATHQFMHPMLAFAAYTGARRSEILRSEREDWNLASGVVTIRQKKSDKSKRFTRRDVPIHPALGEIMKDWFAAHPDGKWAISTAEGEPIGPMSATKYFRRTVRDGPWVVLHGFHTIRHSLASNLAASGADPREINAALGHSTGEMERRYRHLCPKKQASALNALFQVGAK